MPETITITFGDVAENHVGMQQIGKAAKHGFSSETLENLQHNFKKSSFVDLGDEASILIIRNGCNEFGICPNKLFEELKSHEWDSKAFMYGTVKNKHARHNLCWSDSSAEPNYEKKQGRVIAWDDTPSLKTLRNSLSSKLGDSAKDLQAEGNRYFDTQKCGIGYHGDAERKIVIAVRVGTSMKMCFRWYQNSKAVSPTYSIELNHGDMYILSEKATGNDWKSRKIRTMRHAAGCSTYTKI